MDLDEIFTCPQKAHIFTTQQKTWICFVFYGFSEIKFHKIEKKYTLRNED